jgi:RNA polymerase sigma-70 factor (ECF subfamily)
MGLISVGDESGLGDPIKIASFEEAVLPHLTAAYNLAKWLVRNHEDAEDVVQEAYLRAFRAFDGFRGAGECRAWLLTIVRNTSYTRLKQDHMADLTDAFDEEVHGLEDDAKSPEAILVERANVQRLRAALEGLPPEFREVIVLCDLEGMSYHEIADLVGIPMGTVMSRLARARQRLQRLLMNTEKEGAPR